jgi:hypothetical protein
MTTHPIGGADIDPDLEMMRAQSEASGGSHADYVRAKLEITPGKECRRCHEVKPRSFFHRANTTRDGHQPWCKECTRSFARNS